MKKELEIRQQLTDKKQKTDLHKKLLQNGFQYRGNIDQHSYFFDTPQQILAKSKVKFRIRNSLDNNNHENILLTLKLKNMQIINGIREAKEYETWLNYRSNTDLKEINTILSTLNSPQLPQDIFNISLGQDLIVFMENHGYELAEIIKNNRSFYTLGDIDATIDEFYSDEKGNKLSSPQINIEIEGNDANELRRVCALLGLEENKNEQNTWWNACKNRQY